MHTVLLYILYAVDTLFIFANTFFLSVTYRLETISIYLMHRSLQSLLQLLMLLPQLLLLVLLLPVLLLPVPLLPGLLLLLRAASVGVVVAAVDVSTCVLTFRNVAFFFFVAEGIVCFFYLYEHKQDLLPIEM